MADGKRRVTSIAEITGMEGDIIQMQELYHFAREGVDEGGAIQGRFKATGRRGTGAWRSSRRASRWDRRRNPGTVAIPVTTTASDPSIRVSVQPSAIGGRRSVRIASSARASP